jgi:hypothetical protein
MSDKFYKTRDFKKLQREWYDKLADDGFVDIEDGLDDAEFLAGAGNVKSEPLWSAKHAMGVGPAVEVHDALDGAHEAVAYQQGYVASYYRAATQVVTDAMRDGVDPKTVYVWSRLAEGVGDRTIIMDALELEGWHLTRYQVRKLANEFREIVLAQLDEQW